MADDFLIGVKKYMPIITETIAIVLFLLGGFWYLSEQINDLKTNFSVFQATVLDNTKRLNEFASKGSRYTLEDHYRYVDQQAERDAEQNRRLIILEEQIKQRE